MTTSIDRSQECELFTTENVKEGISRFSQIILGLEEEPVNQIIRDIENISLFQLLTEKDDPKDSESVVTPFFKEWEQIKKALKKNEKKKTTNGFRQRMRNIVGGEKAGDDEGDAGNNLYLQVLSLAPIMAEAGFFCVEQVSKNQEPKSVEERPRIELDVKAGERMILGIVQSIKRCLSIGTIGKNKEDNEKRYINNLSMAFSSLGPENETVLSVREQLGRFHYGSEILKAVDKKLETLKK